MNWRRWKISRSVADLDLVGLRSRGPEQSDHEQDGARTRRAALMIMAAIGIGAFLGEPAKAADKAPVVARIDNVASSLELPRAVIPSLDEAGKPKGNYTFVPILQFPTERLVIAQAYGPRYRELVLLTSLGYFAFSARSGVEVDPARLQSLIVARAREIDDLPVPDGVVLLSFSKVDSRKDE